MSNCKKECSDKKLNKNEIFVILHILDFYETLMLSKTSFWKMETWKVKLDKKPSRNILNHELFGVIRACGNLKYIIKLDYVSPPPPPIKKESTIERPHGT